MRSQASSPGGERGLLALAKVKQTFPRTCQKPLARSWRAGLVVNSRTFGDTRGNLLPREHRRRLIGAQITFMQACPRPAVREGRSQLQLKDPPSRRFDSLTIHWISN